MYNCDITRKYEKINKLSKYRNIATNQMKSECITEKYSIPIECKNITTKNQKNQ